MKPTGIKKAFFLLLSHLGVSTAYSRKQDIERRLNRLLAGTTGANPRPLNKDCKNIRVIQVCDKADMYNLYRSLTAGNSVRSIHKADVSEYASSGLTLQISNLRHGGQSLSRLFWSANYNTQGIKEIRFTEAIELNK